MDSPDDEEEAPSLYTLPTLIYFELPFLVSKGRGMSTPMFTRCELCAPFDTDSSGNDNIRGRPRDDSGGAVVVVTSMNRSPVCKWHFLSLVLSLSVDYYMHYQYMQMTVLWSYTAQRKA